MSHYSQRHHADIKNINNAFIISIALNALFTASEFLIGYYTHFLALIADASHNLSDVASLLISLIGIKLMRKAATLTFSYGYKKASIIASLLNSLILIFIVLKIFWEAINRLSTPVDISGNVVMITAFVGVVINGISAVLFFKGQQNDINIKGAFLHLVADTLASLGVVFAGFLIQFTHWNIIDPLVSFAIAFIIFVSTWGLFKESLILTLDGVPREIDLSEIRKILLSHPQVKKIKHLHVWALSTTQNALTVNVYLNDDFSYTQILQIKCELKDLLLPVKIRHTTIEFN